MGTFSAGTSDLASPWRRPSSTQMKLMQSGDVLEERANRVLAELARLPGNGQYGLRLNRVTSRQAGDLAMAYRLSPGDRPPFLLFGDRKGGVFSYSLFSRREPSPPWGGVENDREGAFMSPTLLLSRR
jgi:hypothetical protein